MTQATLTPGLPICKHIHIYTHTSTQASGSFQKNSALDVPWLGAVGVCAAGIESFE